MIDTQTQFKSTKYKSHSAYKMRIFFICITEDKDS